MYYPEKSLLVQVTLGCMLKVLKYRGGKTAHSSIFIRNMINRVYLPGGNSALQEVAGRD